MTPTPQDKVAVGWHLVQEGVLEVLKEAERATWPQQMADRLGFSDATVVKQALHELDRRGAPVAYQPASGLWIHLGGSAGDAAGGGRT